MMQSNSTAARAAMTDFNATSRSPLCELPVNNNPSSLLLAGVDTLGHARALAVKIAESLDSGEGLIMDSLIGAIVHATAMIEAGRKGLLDTAP